MPGSAVPLLSRAEYNGAGGPHITPWPFSLERAPTCPKRYSVAYGCAFHQLAPTTPEARGSARWAWRPALPRLRPADAGAQRRAALYLLGVRLQGKLLLL